MIDPDFQELAKWVGRAQARRWLTEPKRQKTKFRLKAQRGRQH